MPRPLRNSGELDPSADPLCELDKATVDVTGGFVPIESTLHGN